MTTYHMTFIDNTVNDVSCILVHVVSTKKEGCLGIVFFENIKDYFCIIDEWTIIERKV